MTTRPHVGIDHGEVQFPLWVKALSWIVGLCFPVAIACGVWVASAIFDISVRMARMEGQLATTTDDRYRASQAIDAHELLGQKIESNSQDIAELQRLHGRQAGGK